VTAVFFTSDTHFCHCMVAGLRGFGTSEEHDEMIIGNWNRTVRPDDLVWHLGDVGLGNEARILEQASRLNGRKQLITGNHDSCWPGNRGARSRQRRWLEVFESVQAFARIRIDGRPVLLSHFPYEGDHTGEDRCTQYRLPNEGLWLIHGHTHQPDQIDGLRSLHTGLDGWGLHPVSEAAALSRIREHEEGHGNVLVVA
jgi:calcineurin-like phosphoesterase family protein